MRSSKEKVIAIFCADIHLSLNAPIWRSNEPDWFAAMKRPLDEIKEIQFLNNDCPVLCSGDIFDTWDGASGRGASELINFAIENLPDNFWAIPGQHDLPLHNYDDIKKSAYWTLIKSKMINYMHPNTPTIIEDDTNDFKMLLFGFPFGHKIIPIKHNQKTDEHIYIALAHEYKWINGCSYSSAPPSRKVSKIKTTKLGYDIIVYGDNHIGFSSCFTDGTQIFNCGSLMRRHSDQVNYKPQIGLLLSNGNVKGHYLDTSEDKHLNIERKTLGEDPLNLKAFIEELEKLGNSDLDFTEAMEQYLKKNKIKMPICKIIFKAMGL